MVRGGIQGGLTDEATEELIAYMYDHFDKNFGGKESLDEIKTASHAAQTAWIGYIVLDWNETHPEEELIFTEEEIQKVRSQLFGDYL